jgi:hypothetical protein
METRRWLVYKYPLFLRFSSLVNFHHGIAHPRNATKGVESLNSIVVQSSIALAINKLINTPAIYYDRAVKIHREAVKRGSPCNLREAQAAKEALNWEIIFTTDCIVEYVLSRHIMTVTYVRLREPDIVSFRYATLLYILR